MNKKKLLLLVTLVALLLLVSGCTIPMDEANHVITINSESTFMGTMDAEGFFSAIFVYPLAQAINKITPYTNVGIAILLVTVVINAIVLVLTFRQNVAMQKLQALQPEMDRIQRKYEGRTDENSKMRMATEIQNLYKKNNINPLGSMVVMFIQLPILLAVFQAIQRADAVINGTFMGVSLEATILEGLGKGQYVYGLLFVLMLATQIGTALLPQYLNNRHAKEEAEKHMRSYHPTKSSSTQTTTMYVMTAVISIFALSWPAAMSFYWMISNVVNIVKSILVDEMIQKKKN